MNKIDYLEKELSRLLGWIQVADSRMALVIPISTAMLGAIAALSPAVDLWTAKPAIACSFAVFFLVLSFIFSAFASFPRVEGPKGSVIFFGGIVAREIDQFRQSVNALDESSYQDDLINQCHINSQIAITKFTWVRRAMISLFLSFVPWAISVFLLYGIES